MKLLLAVCLTCALLYSAESLHCHVCNNEICSNSSSVLCPATSTVCRTLTSVRLSQSAPSVTVNKSCSSLLSCASPLNIETEWSMNRGFLREAHNQICCITDNCNFPTLAIPNILTNGKQCPSCASPADSLAGTCNVTLSCMGVEDSCFNGTTTSNSMEALQLGCVSGNLCGIQAALEAMLGADIIKITCGAPWSVRISTVLLIFALTAQALV
ncbi:uncharacterized protein [Pempheris klunzingeri]|uniref:uncharacterized protein n=1 Tax=Pempheris klunzingeri TaxID=3127111 RepID=UPI0039805124